MLTEAELREEATAAGFQVEPFEKVLRLIELLEGLRSHPFLKSRLVLKGGTALNLFEFRLPRLSVDIDLNYIGSVDRELMLHERPRIEQAIEAVCSRLGLQVRRRPGDHAGGKWRLSYQTTLGRPGTLELDLNFLLRQPLWSVRVLDSVRIGGSAARKIPVLDLHELAAGKLAALIARGTGRDFFDSRQLLRSTALEDARLRIGFVVYGGINRKDWRKVTIDAVTPDPREIQRNLLPMLGRDHAPDAGELEPWTRSLIDECRTALQRVLPFSDPECEFLEELNGRGNIRPELLTDDINLQQRIADQPGLQWKALNVRKTPGT